MRALFGSAFITVTSRNEGIPFRSPMIDLSFGAAEGVTDFFSACFPIVLFFAIAEIFLVPIPFDIFFILF